MSTPRFAPTRRDLGDLHLLVPCHEIQPLLGPRGSMPDRWRIWPSPLGSMVSHHQLQKSPSAAFPFDACSCSSCAAVANPGIFAVSTGMLSHFIAFPFGCSVETSQVLSPSAMSTYSPRWASHLFIFAYMVAGMGMPTDDNVVGLESCAPHLNCPPAFDAAVLRGRLPNHDVRRETSELFRLLGDPTRVSILHALLVAGELCVCDLAAVVEVAENVVSQALRLLRAADIVRTRRDGRRIHYRLADAHVRMLLDLSADHLGHREPQRSPLQPPEPTAAEAAFSATASGKRPKRASSAPTKGDSHGR